MPSSFRPRPVPPLGDIGSGDEAAGCVPQSRRTSDDLDACLSPSFAAKRTSEDHDAFLTPSLSSTSSPSRPSDEAMTPLGWKVKNLDTGEVRDLLREDSGVARFFGKWEDPSQLRRRARAVWEGWWQEQRLRDEALWRAAEAGNVDELRRVLTCSAVLDSEAGLSCSPTTPSASTRSTAGSLRSAASAPGRAQGRSPACLSTISPPSSPFLSRVDGRGLHGRTALHVAAAADNVECVEELLDFGASIDATTNSGYTAVHLAARRGHLDVVRLLVTRGCNLTMQTNEGELPLHLAAACAHQQVVAFLLEHADGDAMGLRNNFGQRPSEVCSDIATMQLFNNFLLASPAVSVVELTCANHACSTLEMSFASFVQDGYAGRTPFRSGGVLLRNSRADMVRRLLDRTCARAEPKARSGSKEQAEWVLEIGSPGDGDASAGSGFLRPRSRSSWASEGRSRSGGGPFAPPAASSGKGSAPPSPPAKSWPSSPQLGPWQIPALSSQGNWSPRGERLSGDPRRRPSFHRIDSTESTVEVVGPTSFQVLQILGKGSFGEVYQVSHKKTGQVFAMKVLRKSKIVGRNLVRYAMTERNLLSYIRHPFIVRLHYAFQTPSCLVLVLQFCPGGNLSNLITREGCLPEALAKLYTAEVFLAIEHLHERQVVYRDLKPENVVLDETNHAMLTDFGLSKEGVEGLQGTRSFCGSVAYLAPEILARQGHGPTVDLYGLGVLLYETLAGHPPFYSRDREQLFRNIASAQLHAPPRASPSTARLICALMQRDPARRPGAGKTSELRNHAFFASIDWDKLLHKEVPVPPLRIANRTGEGVPRQGAVAADRRNAPGSKEKVASPFEGRMWQVRQKKEQDLAGWEFATSPQLGRKAMTASPKLPRRTMTS